MINYREILDFIVLSLQDQSIFAYVNDNFKKDHLVFVGIDIENVPTKEDMPIIVVEPIIKNIGNSETEFDYQIFLKVMIQGNDKPKKHKNVVIYEGIYQVEELGNIVVEMLRKDIECKTNLEVYDIDFYHDEICAFPLYSGTVAISFSVPNVIGNRKIKFTGV